MPRFKPTHKGLKLLPVDCERQVLPGSFEHALCYLVDHEFDLSGFHARYKNDEEGASAYDPAVLIKIILLAYSRGLVSSRKIEAACRENGVSVKAGVRASNPQTAIAWSRVFCCACTGAAYPLPSGFARCSPRTPPLRQSCASSCRASSIIRFPHTPRL
jgi:hypothetical protein